MKDASFPIDTAELFIGRDITNGICVDSKSVSRRHCCIRQEADLFRIIDLGSRNGTFVNGSPVQERVLKHGDLIRVGSAYLRFLASDSEAQESENEVAVVEGEVTTFSTVALRREDASYLKIQDLSNAAPTDRLVRDLRTLVTVATKIGSIQEPETLSRQVLEMIGEAVPAERGAILLWESRPDEITSQVLWDKTPAGKPTIRVSRTVLRRTANEATALLVKDISAEDALNRAESLAYSRIHSILCAPLHWAQKTFGAIYLDTMHPGLHFDEGDLQLLMGIAGIVSVALVNLQRVERLRADSKRLQAALDAENPMVGESAAMGRVSALISRVAENDSTVTLYGESGTGKELAARAIHRASPRRDGPFITINCAAIPGELLESELFGHEKGAFTGAAKLKNGQIELANGGTLFFDEIGELALSLQAKLLRVLQEREFTRVGGSSPVRVDVRFLAATNRDLAAAVKSGTFREDLYYRLNVISITLPSLRDRREDILLLAKYFAAKFSIKCNREVVSISPEAENYLVRYSWPGNIRELENAIERAIVLGSSEVILPEDLPESILETLAFPQPSAAGQTSPMDTLPAPQLGPEAYHAAVVELKKQLIVKAVNQAGGNYTEAAKSLRVSPNYLHRLIRNLNIKALVKSGM